MSLIFNTIFLVHTMARKFHVKISIKAEAIVVCFLLYFYNDLHFITLYNVIVHFHTLS